MFTSLVGRTTPIFLIALSILTGCGGGEEEKSAQSADPSDNGSRKFVVADGSTLDETTEAYQRALQEWNESRKARRAADTDPAPELYGTVGLFSLDPSEFPSDSSDASQAPVFPNGVMPPIPERRNGFGDGGINGCLQRALSKCIAGTFFTCWRFGIRGTCCRMVWTVPRCIRRGRAWCCE